MAITRRTYLLICAAVLTLTIVYIHLTDIIPLDILFHSQLSHPLHGRSLVFQPWAVVRMRDNQSKWDNNQPLDSVDDKKKDLSKKVQVLVWVMTNPSNLDTKAKAIKDTWGKRPNIMLYFSSEDNKDFPALGLGIPEGRNHLTGKTMAAFRYIYENHFHDADWFMKADDDTYVVVENLRLFLSDKDPRDPIYYGCLFRRHSKQGYFSGGSGYVISKEALRRFGEGAVHTNLCEEDGGSEDVEFGICMEKLGVNTSASEDQLGRSLFHPEKPSLFLLDKAPRWIAEYKGVPVQTGIGVSKYPVSFHYISPDNMRLLDYYLYYIRPYGLSS